MTASSLLVALATVVILLQSASSLPLTYEQEGNLNVIIAANDVLEAMFYTTQMGIRIYSNTTLLKIVALGNDEVLMAGQKTSNSSKLVSIVGQNFLQETVEENGQQRKFQFEVPDSQLDDVKQDLQTRKEERFRAGQRESDQAVVHSVQERAFQRLLAQPEIQLIEQAAEALGRAGVRGTDNQGALQFYASAMSIVKELNKHNKQDSGSGSGDSDETSRKKRQFTDIDITFSPPIFTPITVPPPTPWSICHPGLTMWPWICRRWPIICIRPTLGPPWPFTRPQPGSIRPPTFRNKRLSLAPGYRCCSCSNDICETGSCCPGTTSCNGKCADWRNCNGRCGPGCHSSWWWMCNTACYQQGCYYLDWCGTERLYSDMIFPINFHCTTSSPIYA